MEALEARPTAITAAAVLLFLQAVLLGIVGLISLLGVIVIGALATAAKTWTIDAAVLATIVVIYSLASPPVGLLIGMGLWSMRTWAWKAGLLFEGVQILVILLGLVLAITSDGNGFSWASLPMSSLPVIVGALLLTKRASQAFSRTHDAITGLRL